MSATRNVAGLGRGRLVAALLLVAALGAGLAACRGFFGQAPIALLVTDAGGDGEVPVTITFDISGSNDPDGVIATYELDFGDGSTDATGTDVTVPVVHEYEEDGTFTVLLAVTDNDGRIGMANAVVKIGPVMIVFASDRLGDYDIYRMEADGTDLVSLGSVNATVDDELFPDLVRGTRDRIAYAVKDTTVAWNIWTMTVAGANRTKLTTQTASKQIQPSWSYDASRIAYASNANAVPSATTWEIWSMTAAGGTQTGLTTTSWSLAPAYSPLNNDIVFVSGSLANGTTAATGGSALLKRSAAGVVTVVYDGPGNDGDASRLPTGLAASLGLPTDVGISKPAWSPDGTKIAFSKERTDTGIIDIYVIGASALNGSPAPVSLETYVTGLASYTGSITAGTITSDEDEFSPYWLEDGSGMAFVKEVAGAYHVYKVSFITGLVTKLTDVGANVSPASNR